MTDHPEIWLEPECEKCAMQKFDRLWCQDRDALEKCETCGKEAVRYVLAPLPPPPKEPG